MWAPHPTYIYYGMFTLSRAATAYDHHICTAKLPAAGCLRSASTGTFPLHSALRPASDSCLVLTSAAAETLGVQHDWSGQNASRQVSKVPCYVEIWQCDGQYALQISGSYRSAVPKESWWYQLEFDPFDSEARGKTVLAHRLQAVVPQPLPDVPAIPETVLPAPVFE